MILFTKARMIEEEMIKTLSNLLRLALKMNQVMISTRIEVYKTKVQLPADIILR